MLGPARVDGGAAVAEPRPEPRSAPVTTSAVEIVRSFTVCLPQGVEVTGAADPIVNMHGFAWFALATFGW